MPGHVFLEGANVVLRPIERTDRDLTALGRARNEPALRRSLGFDSPWPESRVAEFVDSVVDDDSSVNLMICVDEGEHPEEREAATSGTGESESGPTGDDQPILGAVNLFDIDDGTGTVSYWLFEEHRGAGYATEAVSLVVRYAFDELGLHRITAEVFEGNDASTSLLDRLGFVHEGTLRENRFSDGSYEDTQLFGLLRGDWDGTEWEGEPGR